MSDHLEVRDGHVTAFVGRSAVDCFRATALAASIQLWVDTGLTYRRLGIRKLLALATEYTGKPYRATKQGGGVAAADVRQWAQTQAATLPKVQG